MFPNIFPPETFKHEKMGIYTSYIFTLNCLAEENRVSEPLKAGKNHRKQADPEATSYEEARTWASIWFDKEESSTKEGTQALTLISAVIT